LIQQDICKLVVSTQEESGRLLSNKRDSDFKSINKKTGNTKMPLPSRIDADQRYNKIRSSALEVTQNSVDSKFKLTQITHEALNAVEQWSLSEQRRYDWDWKGNYAQYRVRYPKRFEIAVWENSLLTALSLGRPTYNATGLRLDIVEAMPRDLGERSNVFEIVILAYEVYARMINANHIRIMNPVNETVKTYYERFGYKYIPKGDYLIRDIL
jgi:hypothetical protein